MPHRGKLSCPLVLLPGEDRLPVHSLHLDIFTQQGAASGCFTICYCLNEAVALSSLPAHKHETIISEFDVGTR